MAAVYVSPVRFDQTKSRVFIRLCVISGTLDMPSMSGGGSTYWKVPWPRTWKRTVSKIWRQSFPIAKNTALQLSHKADLTCKIKPLQKMLRKFFVTFLHVRRSRITSKSFYAVLDEHANNRRHWSSTSAVCHSAEVSRAALSTERSRSSTLCCCGPVDLKFAARQPLWPRTKSQHFPTPAGDDEMYWLLSALEILWVGAK